MARFENKLGMFIHFGIYALTGFQEQAFARQNMDRAEYENLAKKFCPDENSPEEWVIAAKNAGMKYICFTAKHHDGFCMFDTKYTDYNIMNTPFGKDILKLLANACHKHGMRLSLYYSNPDWHYEYGYNPLSTHQGKAVNKDNPNTVKLREFIKNQITELLTNYGKIYTLFFDIPPKIYDPSINMLVRKLQPDILINNRGFDEGDFSTPERNYDAVQNGGHFEKMTEACNSTGEQSWGYRSNEDYYSNRYILSNVDKIMSMGGSYLLNVGPDEKGHLTPKQKAILENLGKWYAKVGFCLEENEEEIADLKLYSGKAVINRKNNKTYIHFYDGLYTDAVSFVKYPEKPKNVRLVNTNTDLQFDEIYLPYHINTEKGYVEEKCLHIFGIDVNRFDSEPPVIEIEWN